MTKTAQTLSSYYVALDHILADTQDAYQAQSALQGIPPMDLTETRKQIQLRADLATQVAAMASLFQKLSDSKAPADASTAAVNLNTELASFVPLASNSIETTAVTVGIREIVALVQQHDEIKAAKKIAPLAHNLSVFFESERNSYDSINQAYLLTARSVSEYMVGKNQVDPSAVFASALRPFDMSPMINQDSIKTGMQQYFLKQIAAGYTLKLSASQKATRSLSGALKEMDNRIELVARDRTMSLRVPPISLASVDAWVAQTTK